MSDTSTSPDAERPLIREAMPGRMSERRSGVEGDPAALEKLQVSVERDFPEGDDHANPRQRIDFRVEVRKAACDLFRRGLVARRCAPHRGRDKCVVQGQAIIRIA